MPEITYPPTGEKSPVAPPMLEGERADAYARRTGHLPPHWSNERCSVFDGQVDERQMAGDRRWLRRWGLLDDAGPTEP
jgi:hypothetical protein